MNYGKAIENLRVTKAFQTQSVFSKNIGITQTYLSLIENNKKKPSTDLLEKIANYCELPMPILFWHCITEEDVRPDRIEAFRLLKKPIDAVIETFF